MLILLRTQVDRTDKTPVTARRARVGDLCGFPDTAAGACAPRGGHICPPCGQFRRFARGLLRGQK